MPVMQVGKVRMAMDKRGVAVAMTVRFSDWVLGPMVMLVMGIVTVAMLMLDGIMDVLVAMTLHKVQIKADPHKDGCGPKPNAWSF